MLEAQSAFIYSKDVTRSMKKIKVSNSRVGEIADDLRQTVFGQEKAVDAVAQRLSIIEAGLIPVNRPLGAIFELGPTGVGKTELARAIATFWFGEQSSHRVLKLNGAEYTQEHDIAKIIGSPNGYIGESSPGIIPHNWLHANDEQKKRKKSIILVDEAEKIHPNVIDKVFLSILDDAKLVTRKGKEGFAPLDFSQTLVIFTSNIASTEIAAVESGTTIGFTQGNPATKKNTLESVVKKGLKEQFKPEFINRLTDTIVFQHLRREDGVYEQIFDKIIAERQTAMIKSLKTRSPLLHIADDVKERIIDSVDTAYGARDLAREIDGQILYGFSDIINTLNVGRMHIWACLDEEDKIGFFASRMPREKKKIVAEVDIYNKEDGELEESSVA